MRLVKDGPDIPDQLIQNHEDGRVVFFCGAGISYPAGLPGFKGLVELVFTYLGEEPTALEKDAIDGYRYDVAIDLLDKRVQNRILVRQKILQILTPNSLEDPPAISTHRALLTLAKASNGQTRLVTTNFDRIFDFVDASIPSYVAPLLPIPKKSRWDGVVYLHGRLPEGEDSTALNNLVVSSGDFGLAYLTERWASRFVTELFANYTVCFVGYSAEDPVLRYMLDALSADQLRGEFPQNVYAFASHRGKQRDDEARAWRAKGVFPVLYHETSGHELLHNSLHVWANLYRDGLTGKSSVITQEAMSQPLRVEGDGQIERVLWAITDLRGQPARTFVELEPPAPIEWLDVFAEKRFTNKDLPRFGILGNPQMDPPIEFSLVNHPTGPNNAPWSSLVSQTSFLQGSTQLTEVQFSIGRWLVKHLDNPRVLHWVIANGGSPHPTLASLIRRRLLEGDLPEPLARIWRLISNGLTTNVIDVNCHDFERQYITNGWARALRVTLRRLLSPYVRFREPYHLDMFRAPTDITDSSQNSKELSIKDYVSSEIVLAGGDELDYSIEQIEKLPDWPERATECLPDFTTLLEDAFTLMAELDSITELSDLSYISRPSVSEHPQNRDFREWTTLVSLCRDAVLFAAKKNPSLARSELDRWKTIRFPIFRRLMFFAAANSGLVTGEEALSLILEDKGWWLWSIETQRESIRLLVSLAPRLNQNQLTSLCDAILEGPLREMFVEDLTPEEWTEIVERNVWLRLAKINAATGGLPTDAEGALMRISEKHPSWKLEADDRDEFPSWMESGSGMSFRRKTVLPEDNESNLAQSLIDPARKDHWQEDNWREICQRNPGLAIKALKLLATKDEWPSKSWREALQVYSEETQTLMSFRELASSLQAAPDEIFKELIHPVSWWLTRIPKFLGSNPDDAWLALVDRVLDCSESEDPSYDDDPVGRAINHPLGHVTDALIRTWFLSQPKRDQGLPTFLTLRLNRISSTDRMKLPYGRVILGSQLISLFMADRNWVSENLIPHFDWKIDAREARGTWEGYLWSPRISQDLLEAIKDCFLDTANHYVDLGKHGTQYSSLLGAVALSYGNAISAHELRTALNALPVKGLAAIAKSLSQSLADAGDRNTEQWQNRVRPLIEDSWPKSADKQSPEAASPLAQVCIHSGSKFPEAIKVISPLLKRTRNYDLAIMRLVESELACTYPADALDLLDGLVDDANQWPPEELSQCLKQISEADVVLTNSPKFRRLNEYISKHAR